MRSKAIESVDLNSKFVGPDVAALFAATKWFNN